MQYLTVQQVLRIQARSIEQFGGAGGVRDLGLIESKVVCLFLAVTFHRGRAEV
jgi:hypothetical protein